MFEFVEAMRLKFTIDAREMLDYRIVSNFMLRVEFEYYIAHIRMIDRALD